MDEQRVNGSGRRRSRPRGLPLTLLAILVCAVAVFFSSPFFEFHYAGLTAFFAIPAALGGLLSYAVAVDRTHGLGCFVWPTLGLLAIVGVAWAFIGEGAICIAMILPIWIPAAITGYAVSWWNSKNPAEEDGNDVRLQSSAWLMSPLAIFATEQYYPLQWQVREVRSEILVRATADQIWPLLVSIPKISESEGTWNFTQNILGVPRPAGADLIRRNGQWVRKAVWGKAIRFEEQIVALQPSQTIDWKFEFQDRSIERTVDRHISPVGYNLRIETGRYDLLPASNGYTKIRLSTRYRMRTRLPWYFNWWGNQMLGDIQNNVLSVVKDRAEKTVHSK